MPASETSGETILGANDLLPCRYLNTRNPEMAGPFANDSEQIDRRTSRSICDAVGERLQQSIRPESRLPTHLEHLLNELRKRDLDTH
jgi:hypothetical protein